MYRVFIDGQQGTTGLQIRQRLANHPALEVLLIDESQRKNPAAKQQLMQQADVTVLCLPDEAAIEVAKLNPKSRLLDASTAHRVNKNWVYGLAELNPEQRSNIANAQCVSNPGCYPTGLLLLLRPIIEAQLLPRDFAATVNAISGYSGGGHNMVDEFNQANLPESYNSRPYALSLEHKHIPEMHLYSGLKHAPVFSPSVANFAQGMLVMVPVPAAALGLDIKREQILNCWQQCYGNENNVQIVTENSTDTGFLTATDCNGSNHVELMVTGNQDQLLLIARLDNLGKGASGAAVQNLNIMLGLEENLATALS